MFCTKCGTQNDDNATTCISCGNALRPATYVPPVAPPQAQPPQPPPPPQAPIAQAYVPAPQQQMPGMVRPNIPNYLVQAILVTVCCCLPFGIVSIIFAAQVNSKLTAGDINGAMESSRQAKLFAWIGFGIGGAGVLVYVLLMMLGLVAGIASNAH
ncbi:MAG TPA: CD225/dispanin family protein [Candidatus Koribacter sp.]|jgi:hypothetical protein